MDDVGAEIGRDGLIETFFPISYVCKISADSLLFS